MLRTTKSKEVFSFGDGGAAIAGDFSFFGMGRKTLEERVMGMEKDIPFLIEVDFRGRRRRWRRRSLYNKV